MMAAPPETQPYRSPSQTAVDGFRHVIRAEWTKFRSVRSTAWCLILAVVLTAALSMFGANASSTDVNTLPPIDQFSFVHRPLAGDGAVVAQVRTQRGSHEWAKAGIMIKQDTQSGSPYAALMVTPGHGVRLQADFATDIAGAGRGAPRWLKLTRSGPSITGYESADGTTWKRVGTVRLRALPPTVEVGMFVSSPPIPRIQRLSGGNRVVGATPTAGAATFAGVSVTAATPQPTAGWTHLNINPAPGQEKPGAEPPATGGFTAAGDTLRVTGSGDVGAAQGDDDIIESSLVGILIGLMAIAVLGALFATSEYKTGIIRTTFAAGPRRGRVLAAKAIVLGGVTFAVGLVAVFATILLTQPIMRSKGFAPPGYPRVSLTDATVLRALIGTAAALAVIALFSLGVGALVRRTAGAVSIVIALILVPQVIADLLTSLTASQWIRRITPAAGLAIVQTTKRYDAAIGPWAGFAVLCAFAVLALGAGWWRIRRKDA